MEGAEAEGAETCGAVSFESNPFSMDRLTNKRYMSLFDIEHWYTPLAEAGAVTANTLLLPITRTEATAITSRYRRHWNVGTLDVSLDQQESVLAALANRIDEARAALGCDAMFARLSTRSPKDAGQDPAGHPEAVALCAAEMSKVGGREAAPSEMMKACLRACGAIMCVRNGAEVLSLLTASERTYTDLCRTVEDTDVEWRMGVVLRSWVAMDLGDEYRCS